jgi:hypothetical protein
VIAVANWTLASNQLREYLFAPLKRQLTQIIITKGQQVEGPADHRHRETEPGDLPRIFSMHSALEELKAWAELVIRCHNFTIEDESVERQLG